MINIIKPIYYYTSQLFGENLVNFYKKLGMKGHNGIDYKAVIGTLIFAPCDMILTGTSNDSYGKAIWGLSNQTDDKGQKLQFIFGHMSSFIETRGEVVMGQPIGYSGNTGKYTTGPHLHFGVRPMVRDTDWLPVDRKNGYFGYEDPEKYFFKSFQYEPTRLFKQHKGPGFYQLGVDGRHHILGRQIFGKLIAKEFEDIDYHQLKVKLPKSYARLLIAGLEQTYKIITGKIKSFKI